MIGCIFRRFILVDDDKLLAGISAAAFAAIVKVCIDFHWMFVRPPLAMMMKPRWAMEMEWRAIILIVMLFMFWSLGPELVVVAFFWLVNNLFGSFVGCGKDSRVPNSQVISNIGIQYNRKERGERADSRAFPPQQGRAMREHNRGGSGSSSRKPRKVKAVQKQKNVS